MDALFFRIVLLWLCKKRENTKIVAVFAGTTAKLKNFAIEDDLKAELETDTRKAGSDPNEYFKRGRQMFTPFFSTTTIGCLRKNEDIQNIWTRHTEHFAATLYGRPLFAVMTKEEYKTFLPEAFARILLDDGESWEKNGAVWLNILATRVQMGQTSFEIAIWITHYVYMTS